jgi:hypothetical protein
MSVVSVNEASTKDVLPTVECAGSRPTAPPVGASGIASDAGGIVAHWGNPSQVGARAAELARALYARIRERPLTSLAVAVGVGLLVGGALSFRAGRLALVAAARRVGQEVLRQVL